jgi:predicted nucleic acid-binding protein
MRSKASSRAQRISKAEQQRIVRDVLIARTAHRAGATLITDDLSDFEKIKRFCNVRLTPGSAYFNR